MVVIGQAIPMGTMKGLGGGGGVMIRPLVPYFEAFLLHDGEPEEGGVLQHGDGPRVGN